MDSGKPPIEKFLSKLVYLQQVQSGCLSTSACHSFLGNGDVLAGRMALDGSCERKARWLPLDSESTGPFFIPVE